MSIAEDENFFVSELTSLGRELKIKTNAIRSQWREGKYTAKEKNQAINEAYRNFLGEIIKLKKQIPELIQSPKDEDNFYKE